LRISQQKINYDTSPGSSVLIYSPPLIFVYRIYFSSLFFYRQSEKEALQSCSIVHSSSFFIGSIVFFFPLFLEAVRKRGASVLFYSPPYCIVFFRSPSFPLGSADLFFSPPFSTVFFFSPCFSICCIVLFYTQIYLNNLSE